MRVACAMVLALGLGAVVAAADPPPPLPGFVIHFDFIGSVREARALVRVASEQGAGVISIVPPAHVWENRTAVAMLDAIVADAARRGLRVMFSRIDAAYPPDARGRRDNFLYGHILSDPGRLPDGRPTADFFLATAGRAGYTEWMIEETRYYASRYGRLPNLIGFTLGPFVEPFASERGGFLQYDGRTDRYELTQYTPEAAGLWHRWLAGRWGSVDGVNRAYDTSFRSIDGVPLPASDLDPRFGLPLAAYTDFARSLDEWFEDAYRRCRAVWHEVSGRPDVPFILQFSGFEAEKIAKGRPGLAAFDLPAWIAGADAVALSLYANGGYPDRGHASIAATVRLLALARELGKDVFVMEAGYENPGAIADPRELGFLAEAAASLAPRTWIYEFLKDKFDEQYAVNPGKLVRADGRLRVAAAAAVRDAFARAQAAGRDAESPAFRLVVRLDDVRVNRRIAVAANATFALAAAVPVRWSPDRFRESTTSDVPVVRLGGHDGARDPLTSLLLSAPEPGTDEREQWIRAVAAWFTVRNHPRTDAARITLTPRREEGLERAWFRIDVSSIPGGAVSRPHAAGSSAGVSAARGPAG
jgi:hypothetical protein